MLGSETATSRRLASPVRGLSETSRLAPFACEVFADVEAANDGLKPSDEHPLAWKGVASATVAPAPTGNVGVPETVLSSGCAAQLVGLSMNPGRFMLSVIVRRRSGAPPTISGIAPGAPGRGVKTVTRVV
jgi:hypothetical protein